MKQIVKGIALVLAMMTSSAQAIPTLFFDGNDNNGGGINYTTGGPDNILNVSGSLLETDDVVTPVNLIGSTIEFSALFLDFETIAGVGFFGVDSTKGNFIGDPLADDLTIFDGDGVLLLTANFDSLTIEGENGSSQGGIFAILSATDGLLMSSFDNSNLFALQLNLTTTFSDAMFESDFSGDIDGSIQGTASVPEPGMLALLSLGLLITGFARKSRRSI